MKRRESSDSRRGQGKSGLRYSIGLQHLKQDGVSEPKRGRSLLIFLQFFPSIAHVIPSSDNESRSARSANLVCLRSLRR
jgi:hypothetical protein